MRNYIYFLGIGFDVHAVILLSLPNENRKPSIQAEFEIEACFNPSVCSYLRVNNQFRIPNSEFRIKKPGYGCKFLFQNMASSVNYFPNQVILVRIVDAHGDEIAHVQVAVRNEADR